VCIFISVSPYQKKKASSPYPWRNGAAQKQRSLEIDQLEGYLISIIKPLQENHQFVQKMNRL
jgi:hypothetical protein